MGYKSKTCEHLFYEIGKLLALCKTVDEQRRILSGILQKIEAQKMEPHQSMDDENAEIQKQLKRYYKKGFARWAVAQRKIITDEIVAKKGCIFSYNEESKRHEPLTMPLSLKHAFNDGWRKRKKAA